MPKTKPRYTTKDRADAILICSIAASNPDLTEDYTTTAKLLGLLEPDAWDDEPPALDLAIDAWDVARSADPDGPGAAVDAEAECLLREGWTP